jgi:ribulose-phosphate 3-epimerase
LEEIRNSGAGVGITLNPATPIADIEGFLELCDLVLVMSVMPGFGGQEFQPVAIEKIRQARKRLGPDALVSVDGGINRQTIEECAAAGANVFVTGSALFSQPDYGRFIEEMTGLARSFTMT